LHQIASSETDYYSGKISFIVFSRGQTVHYSRRIRFFLLNRGRTVYYSGEMRFIVPCWGRTDHYSRKVRFIVLSRGQEQASNVDEWIFMFHWGYSSQICIKEQKVPLRSVRFFNRFYLHMELAYFPQVWKSHNFPQFKKTQGFPWVSDDRLCIIIA
jgi:hypothetical protein